MEAVSYSKGSQTKAEFAKALDTMILRSSTMESVRHVCLTDAKTKPGLVLRTANEDCLMQTSIFNSESHIRRFKLFDDVGVRDSKQPLASRTVSARALGTPTHKFSERAARNFINHFLKTQARDATKVKNPKIPLKEYVEQFEGPDPKDFWQSAVPPTSFKNSSSSSSPRRSQSKNVQFNDAVEVKEY